MRKKTKQSKEKASEHNESTVFSRSLELITRASMGVVSTLSYCSSSICFNLS